MPSTKTRINLGRRVGMTAVIIIAMSILLMSTFLSYGQDEPLSPQDEIIDKVGFPHRFTIAYVPWGEDGNQLIRYETWTYANHRKEITFIGGEILAVTDIPPETAESAEDALDDAAFWGDELFTGNPFGEGEWDEEQWIADYDAASSEDTSIGDFYDEWLYEDDYIWVDYPLVSPDMIDFDMGYQNICYAVGTSNFQRVDALIEGFEEEGIEVYLGDNILFCLQEGYLLYFEAFGTEVTY
jgi:hypothetical protein